MNRMIWVLFVGLLWACASRRGHGAGVAIGGAPGAVRGCRTQGRLGRDGISTCEMCQSKKTNKHYFTKGNKYILVADNFSGIITAQHPWNKTGNVYIAFLQKNRSETKGSKWFQMETKDGAQLLYISKGVFKKQLDLFTMQEEECNPIIKDITCASNYNAQVCCQVKYLNNTICKQHTYDENYCSKMVPQVNNKYIINVTDRKSNCHNCNTPVKNPEVKLDLNDLSDLNVIFEIKEGEELNPAQAALKKYVFKTPQTPVDKTPESYCSPLLFTKKYLLGIMNKMTDVAAFLKDSSAALTIGEGVTGILVKETNPRDVDEVSFAYASPNDSINIIESRDKLDSFSRSVTVTKEAFDKAVSLNVTIPFAAVIRFHNLAKDESKSTVLGNEVLAIEMGTIITNLTDNIRINFRNTKYEGIPSCQSWNGEGSLPKWTDDGCRTINKGNNITCQCSHLTFFAILLAPLNETISSSDVNNLTIITQVGCGLSMLFLAIILFMHFLLRRTKASKATRILIHLVSAMFLLNFTFLINNFVAKLKSSVGCKIMAALMHYFMLVTFTWFAVQAFHLCLQLYTGGKIVIRHYVLKVSITSWVLPSVVGIVLLILGKYGEQFIYTNDTDENVAMCWITDGDVHYVVNIGYYVLVFLFTFTTFIVILSWLFYLSRTKSVNAQIGRSGKSIVIILGLCCMLGFTWSFAFFAYGDLRIPSYYIFTVLNSFQGFFLFIYYYYTSHSGEIQEGAEGHNILNNTSTSATCLGELVSPYANTPAKK